MRIIQLVLAIILFVFALLGANFAGYIDNIILSAVTGGTVAVLMIFAAAWLLTRALQPR